MTNTLRKTLVLILFSFIVFNSINAQSLRAYINAADQAYATNDYFTALVYYKKVLEVDANRYDIYFKYAESARQFQAYRIAEDAYQKITLSKDSMRFPLATYWLGTVKKNLAKYDEAEEVFNDYLVKYKRVNPRYSRMAEKNIIDCRWAKRMMRSKNKNMKVEHIKDGINTPYSEFGAIQVDSIVYFSSMKFKDKSNMFYSKLMKRDKEGEIEIFEFNTGDKFAANPSISFDGNRLFYTLCKYTASGKINCEIVYRDRKYDDVWGEAQELPAFINFPGFTSTHPTIGYDKLNNREVLFFSSNRPGGKGKLDIWYSTVAPNGKFTRPVNHSVINSRENDVTPFFHSPSQVLYFSSDGYPGMGGYDIYKVKRVGRSWQTPIHLTYPVSSSYNDFYFALNEDGNKSYFASNRIEALEIDKENEACCNDLFIAKIPPEKVELTKEEYLALIKNRNTDYVVDDWDEPKVIVNPEIGTEIEIGRNLNSDFYETVIDDSKTNQPSTIATNDSSNDSKNEVSEIPTNDVSNDSKNEVSEVPTNDTSNDSKNKVSEVPTNDASNDSKNEVSEVPTNDASNDSKNEVSEVPTNDTSNDSKNEVSEVPTKDESNDSKNEVSEVPTKDASNDSKNEVSEVPTNDVNNDNKNNAINSDELNTKGGEKVEVVKDEPKINTSPSKDGLDPNLSREVFPLVFEVEVLDMNLEPLSGVKVDFIEHSIESNLRNFSKKINSGNKVKFRIKNHVNYSVILSKPGFVTDTFALDRENLWDATELTLPFFMNEILDGSDFIESPLKDQLEEELVDENILNGFLPLALYFNNNEPDPTSWSFSTNLNYEQTFLSYYSKQERFKDRYVRKFAPSQREDALNKVEDFFEKDLKKNYDVLMEFSNQLAKYLEKGNSIKLGFQGVLILNPENYKSTALVERRISSLENHFKTHLGGKLNTYIDQGLLKFEILDPIIIKSANVTNETYSPEASKLRRVEIKLFFDE